jgi:hypothetical protein
MRVQGLCWLGLMLLLAEVPLPAQIGGYPGQYPPGGYPPGGYPPGYPYPPIGVGGVGLPIPHRKKKDTSKDKENAQLQTIEGMLRRIDQDQIVLEADDTRILNFKRTKDTTFLKEGDKIKPSDLKPGDHLVIEASQDDQGFMTAVHVGWQRDGTAEERARAAADVPTSVAKSSDDEDRPHLHRADSSGNANSSTNNTNSSAGQKDTSAAQDSSGKQQPSKPAAQTAPQTADAAPSSSDPNPADLNAPVKEDVPAVKIDADDQGPPVLKRGKKEVNKPAAPPPPVREPEPQSQPQLSASNEGPTEETTASIQPVAGHVPESDRPEDVVIEKAREAAGSFLESLPNYVCQEFMTRYINESHPVSWQPQDVVSTELVYEDGHEHYRKVAINGKLTNKSMEDLPGSWSTGEFGTVLADVFSPSTAADFRFRRESQAGGRSAMVYDFTVDHPHSHWRIMVASQMVQPSYRGSVWIDKETNRVLRIEMQATHLPDAFPSDQVESATDYQYVRFADRQFLVPVHAETLSCQRGTSLCSRNTIDFRNYHKYSGEATITFDK